MAKEITISIDDQYDVTKAKSLLGVARGHENVRIADNTLAIFLEELMKHGNRQVAALRAGFTYPALKKLADDTETYPDLHAVIDAAHAVYLKTLEDAAHTRAIKGVRKPIVGGKDKDQIVAYERVHSDGLLQMLMKAADREKYAPTPKADIGKIGGVLVVPGAMTMEQWATRNDKPVLDGDATEVEKTVARLDGPVLKDE